MSNLAELLERESRTVDLELGDFERLTRRRDRRRRNQRVAAGVLGIAVFALAAIGLARLLGSEGTPATDPRSPFEGTWVSTSDADGGTQTMIVSVSAEGTVEITVLDDVATVCGGTPSTMTGTGRIEGGAALVIPAPVYTCDDGTEPETLSGPPLEEILRDWTLVRDPETDTLSDGAGGLWWREGAELPSPGPTISGQMWPQTSSEEVREAQELADAGDPRYTWQVDPVLAADSEPWGAEIFERFLREELGWEAFSSGFSIQGYGSMGEGGGLYDGVVFIRCEPGQTNPLSSMYPSIHPGVRGCAPTIDDFRYETVRFTVEQPARRGPSGIWVVTGWEMLQSAEPRSVFEHLYADFDQRQVEQLTPPTDADVTSLLQAFLGARVDGEGAERYLHVHEAEGPPFGAPDAEVPILYATTRGTPYQRFEIEREQGPVWPTGWIEFTVRLFAEDGTVVEQSFVVVRQENGRLGLVYGSPDERPPVTTENGEAVPLPYRFLDGEVAFAAAPPWANSFYGSDHGPTFTTLIHGHSFNTVERIEIVADPLPVGSGCETGPTPADAEALARSIRSNPDLDATAPVSVSVGGVDALRMDVAAVPGASECDEDYGVPLVLTEHGWLEQGERMRLYLLDLTGGSARILAIAVAAPEPDFGHTVEAAAPILDSFEFQAP
jgi:hypothetical protein